MAGVRVDKWLWAARFFKTRSIAARSCELGRVKANWIPAKPAREVRTGDLLEIRTEGGEFQVFVLGLSETRGSAPVAQLLFEETDDSKAARAKAAEERKALPAFVPQPGGKLSKRNRRDFDRLRGRG